MIPETAVASPVADELCLPSVESCEPAWVVIVSDIPLAPSDHGSRARSRQLVEVLRREGYRVAYILWERYPCAQQHELVQEMSARVDELLIVPYNLGLRSPASAGGMAARIGRKAGRLLPRRIGRYVLNHALTKKIMGRVGWWGFRESNPADWDPPALHDALHTVAMSRPVCAVIAQYVYLTQVLPMVQAHGITGLVDTIDVLHRRKDAFRKRGLMPDSFMVSKETESRLLNLADYVIAIQSCEAEVLRTMVAPQRVLTIEHAVTPTAVECADDPVEPIVALVGSDNPNNVDGLRWFLHEVWPGLLKRVPAASLQVYGRLAETPACRGPRVQAVGFVNELADAYRDCLVVINPVCVGTGLKIKTVDGLAAGRALVTTSVGAEGLEDGAGEAYVLADGPEEFAGAVASLLRNPIEARRLGERAQRYVEKRLGSRRVFKPLVHVLKQSRADWQYQRAQASQHETIRRPGPPRPQLMEPWQDAWVRLDRDSMPAIEDAVRSAVCDKGGIDVEFWTAAPIVGGAERQTIRLAQRLNQLGFRCQLRVPESSAALRDEIAAAGLEQLSLANDQTRPAKDNTLVHLVACHILDLLDIQQAMAQGDARWLITYQLTFTWNPPLLPNEERQRLRQTWRDASRVCFVSDYDRRLVNITVGLNDVSHAVVWNGTDTEPRPDCTEAPGHSDSDSGVFTWLWSGAIREQKRPDLLLQAVRAVRDLAPHQKMKVWMAGTGPLEADLRCAIRDARLGDVVELLGWQPKMQERYRRADGLVLTSDYEGTPLCVVEAMHSGKPIVATAAGGVREIVRHGHDALLSAPGDWKATARNMLRIMDDPDVARRLGAGAQAVARDALTLRESALRYALLYLGGIGGGSKTSK